MVLHVDGVAGEGRQGTLFNQKRNISVSFERKGAALRLISWCSLQK
jgi:hypothetical protein